MIIGYGHGVGPAPIEVSTPAGSPIAWPPTVLNVGTGASKIGRDRIRQIGSQGAGQGNRLPTEANLKVPSPPRRTSPQPPTLHSLDDHPSAEPVCERGSYHEQHNKPHNPHAGLLSAS